MQISRHTDEDLEFCENVCYGLIDRYYAEDKLPSGPVERVVVLAHKFFEEEQGGSLSQFFYNTDASATYANETVNALATIGARESARILSLASTVVCRPEHSDYAGTWSGYLSIVDPESTLDMHAKTIGAHSEVVESCLNDYIIAHKDILKSAI